MQIPKKIFLKFLALYDHGDAVLISDKYGCAPETVRRALRTGRASEDVFRFMTEFYEERQALLDAHISQ